MCIRQLRFLFYHRRSHPDLWRSDLTDRGVACDIFGTVSRLSAYPLRTQLTDSPSVIQPSHGHDVDLGSQRRTQVPAFAEAIVRLEHVARRWRHIRHGRRNVHVDSGHSQHDR